MTQESERRLKALADSGRLSVLTLVHEASEICVCHIEQILKLPQPTVSRHLQKLKEAGWLMDRREGRWVHYRLADLEGSRWRIILDVILAETGNSSRFKEDLQRLKDTVKCDATINSNSSC